MIHGGEFVNRHREIAALNTWWARVLESRSSAALSIEGPAGIGKSALLDHWLASLGEKVLIAHGTVELGMDTPFECLRKALTSERFTGLSAAAERARARCLEQLNGSPEALADEEQLIQLLSDFLHGASGGEPVIIVVENIHHASEDMLHFCTRLARFTPLPVFLITTLRAIRRRTSLGFEGFLDRLAEHGTAHRLELDPLSQDSVSDLMRAMRQREPSPVELREVMEYSRGIPIYVVLSMGGSLAQLVDGEVHSEENHQAEGSLIGPDGGVAILRLFVPEGSLQEELGAQLSMLGRFDFDNLRLVAQLSGRNAEEAELGIRSLLDIGVLVWREGQLEFTHPIVRQAFAQLLPEPSHSEVHLDIATQLRERADAAKTDQTTSTAARFAQDPLETREDVTGVGPTSEVSEEVPKPAELWFDQVRQAHADSGLAPSQSSDEEIFALLQESRLTEAWKLAQRFWLDSPTITGPGLPTTSPDLTTTQVDAASTLAFLTKSLDECIAIVDAAKEPSVLALGNALISDLLLGNGAAASRRYSEAAPLLRSAVNPPIVAAVQLHSFAAMTARDEDLDWIYECCAEQIAQGLPAESSMAIGAMKMHSMHYPAHFTPARPLLARQPTPESEPADNGPAQSHVTDWARGRWDTVLEEAPIEIDILKRSGNALGLSTQASWAAAVAVERDDIALATAFVNQVPDPIDTFHCAILAWSRARILRTEAQPDDAIQVLTEALALLDKGGVIVLRSLVTDLLAEMMAEAGAVDEAAKFSRASMEAIRPLRIPLLDVYALLSFALHHHEVGAAQFAAKLAADHQFPLLEGRAHALVGALGAEPARHFRLAHRIFRSLGAVSEKRRCEQQMQTREVSLPISDISPSQLSEIESAIVRGVLDGMTNRQIANSLHYSPKTIEMYLSRIYSRTKVSGRVELVKAVGDGAVELRPA